VPPLEVGFTVLDLHGGELTPQNLDEEIPATARRL